MKKITGFFTRIFGAAAALAAAIINVCCLVPAVVYAAPVTDSVTGRVTDSATSSAIRGIRVTLLAGAMTGTALSDSNGNYTVTANSFTNIVQLTAEDIDGVTNGKYLSKTYTITLPTGTLSTNVDIRLDTNTN